MKPSVPNPLTFNPLAHYEILAQIGEGGFGRIFQARHRLLDELACLKQNINADPEHVELLRQEGKILWRLYEHHSIPSVKEFCKIDEKNAVLVTTYIDGKTLEETVEKEGRLHPEDTSWIVERLLGALFYCHYNGVVHSDIKPQNLFIEPTKHDIKLIDFGLSVFRPTAKTTPVGTTEMYAAPELLLGKPPIPETDLYGAGIVMLYALGGDLRCKAFPKDTPKELREFCARLLRYDPSERPNWSSNLFAQLSDARFVAFGRRHMSE